MPKHYKLVLRNEKTKTYDRFAFFLFFVNLVLLGLILYATAKTDKVVAVIMMSVFAISLTTIALLFIKRQELLLFRLISIGNLLIGGAFFFTAYWWLGPIVILPGILHHFSKKDLELIVGEEYISYPSFPPKKINWAELSNVVLKDRLLTIDFKNDRLVQQFIDDKSYGLDEREFNEFCRQQLTL